MHLRNFYFVARLFYHTYILSKLIALFLRLLGVHVGKNFFAREFPIIIADEISNIRIGNNVSFNGKIDLRALKGSTLVLGNNARLDTGVRILVTNFSKAVFGDFCDIGCYSIFNCGENFNMGANCLVAGHCYFQTSNHGYAAAHLIRDQDHIHCSIDIGDDCWFGGGVFVLPGANCGTGVVIGANSVVNSSISHYNIAVGSPAKVIRNRKDF